MKKIILDAKTLIIKGRKGDQGDNYILTEQDKTDIAKTVVIPVVEKVIEKTETIKQPIVTEITKITNEIKEVAILETPQAIRDKLETLVEEDRLDVSAIKGFDKTIADLKSTNKSVQVIAGGGRSVTVQQSGTTKTKLARVLNFKGTGVPTITQKADGSTDLDFSGGGSVTSVGATAPITSSGGTTPTISTSMTTNKLIGRGTAATGVMEEITLGTNLSLSGTTLNASGGGMSIGGAVTSGTAGSVLFVDGSGNLGQDNSNFFWDGTNHRLGLGTTSPTNDISLSGQAAKIIWMERETTAATAGNDLTIQAGGAKSGGTNLAGGNLNFLSGTVTGSGASSINFKIPNTGASGTGDNTPTTQMIFRENPAAKNPQLIISDNGTDGPGFGSGDGALLSVYQHSNLSTGKVLFRVGSQAQTNQFIIAEQTATTFIYGLTINGAGLGLYLGSPNANTISGVSNGHTYIQFNDLPLVNGDMTISAHADIIFLNNESFAQTEHFRIATAGVSLQKKVIAYNAINTTGWGHPAIYGSGRSVAQTAAITSVATYTCGAADGSFLITSNVNVTTSTAHSFTVTCAYTDETNTARTLTLSFIQIGGGTPIATITNVTGVGPYEGVPNHIRCKASTAITIATTGTFTTVTYNVESSILQIS